MNPSLLLPVIFTAGAAAAFAALWGLTAFIRLVRPAGAAAGDDGRTLVRAVVASRTPRDWEGRLDRSFERMVRSTLLGLAPQQALAFLALGAATTGSLCFLFWNDWLAAGLGLLGGAAVPTVVLMALQRRWLHAVQQQLPDGLFLLARSLRAGLSLEQAIVAVQAYCTRPLLELFGRCAEQIEMGLSAPEALLRMADATNLADFRALASVAVLHRDVGGHLPTLIDRLAAGVRDRNQFRNFFRSATALSRATATFLALAPPAIAAYLMWDQPELFHNFFESGLGMTVFGVAVALEIVGVVWLYLLLRRIDY